MCVCVHLYVNMIYYIYMCIKIYIVYTCIMSWCRYVYTCVYIHTHKPQERRSAPKTTTPLALKAGLEVRGPRLISTPCKDFCFELPTEAGGVQGLSSQRVHAFYGIYFGHREALGQQHKLAHDAWDSAIASVARCSFVVAAHVQLISRLV